MEKNPEIFLKIKLDNTRSFKDLSEGERLFNERKIKESLEFFKIAEKECNLFKNSYYTVTGIATVGLGLPLAKLILSDSIDPLYKGLAHCYFWSEDYINSIVYFDKISKKDFTDYYIEAWANYKIGNIEKAKDLYLRSKKQQPELAGYSVPID